MKRKLLAYAELMRLPNAPTVVTNVLAGIALAGGNWHDVPFFVVFVASVLSLYFFGMILNDLVDLGYDMAHKPGRPIPSGRVSRVGAMTSAALLLLFSFIAGLPLNFAWYALVICIVSYNVLHKRFAFTVFLMGMCRAFTYLYAYIWETWGGVGVQLKPANSPEIVAVFFASIAYIVLLTFVARREDDGSVGWRAKLSVLMPLTIVAPAVVIANAAPIMPQTLAASSIFAVWMARSCWLLLRSTPDVRGAVMGWLSGICLFDAALLSANGNDNLAFVAIGCFVLTAMGHRHMCGT